MNTMINLKKTTMLAVALTVLLVAGCSRVTIDAETLDRGNELCKENKGLASIDTLHDWVYPNFTCNNGVIFKIYGTRIERHEPIDSGN